MCPFWIARPFDVPAAALPHPSRPDWPGSAPCSEEKLSGESGADHWVHQQCLRCTANSNKWEEPTIIGGIGSRAAWWRYSPRWMGPPHPRTHTHNAHTPVHMDKPEGCAQQNLLPHDDERVPDPQHRLGTWEAARDRL